MTSVIGGVTSITNNIKFNISTSGSCNNLPKRVILLFLKDLPNPIIKLMEKISFHNKAVSMDLRIIHSSFVIVAPFF